MQAAAWRGDSCSPVAQLTRVEPAFLHKLNSDCPLIFLVAVAGVPQDRGREQRPVAERISCWQRGSRAGRAEQGWGWVRSR